MIGILIVFLVWIGGLIYFNLRKRVDSNDSILFRILMNYLHVLTSTMSFSLNYPDWMLDLFEPLRTVGESQEMVISFDCFLSDTRMNFFGSSDFIFKTFCSCCIPFVVIALIMIIWMGLKLIM